MCDALLQRIMLRRQAEAGQKQANYNSGFSEQVCFHCGYENSLSGKQRKREFEELRFSQTPYDQSIDFSLILLEKVVHKIFLINTDHNLSSLSKYSQTMQSKNERNNPNTRET